MMVTYADIPTFVVRNYFWEEHATTSELLEEMLNDLLECSCELAIDTWQDVSGVFDMGFAVSSDLSVPLAFL